MHITSFDDLLQAARRQAEPQRLLFVFASSSVPQDATPAQKEQHARGEGGELTPRLCVDKTHGELSGFDALVQESGQTGQDWQVVFVAAMADPFLDPLAHDLPAPDSTLAPAPDSSAGKAVDQAFQRMTQMIKYGTIGALLAFNRSGEPLQFGAA